MKFNVITIFPKIITDYCNESVLGRGQKNGAIDVHAIDLRDFSDDPHKKVDDTPYGGGPGMIMKPEPMYKALKSIDAIPFRKADGLTKLKKVFTGMKGKKRTILLSPRGRQFDQRVAEEWSSLQELTLICGRYEGVDQRVVDHMVDEEVSIGPYVLAGGELGALVMIEAVSRLVPGVLGNPESLAEETYATIPPNHHTTQPPGRNKKKSGQVVKWSSGEVMKEYPQYTKPADFLGWTVPDILLSGDHKKIAQWRKEVKN